MTSWIDTVLEPDASMADAVQTLEKSRKFGICLILDRKKKLLGTITNGDIRRALIKQLSMATPVLEVMNKEPAVVRSGYAINEVRKLLVDRFVEMVPVLDNQGHVIDLVGSDSAGRKYSGVPILLMAGGFGKRLLPLTEKLPKPLLKVSGKPIIQLIVEQLAAQGFRHIFVSVHYRGDMIRDFLGDGEKWDVDFRYLEEDRPLGTAGALSLLPDTGANGPLLIINSDLMTKLDYRWIIDFHNARGGGATVCTREYSLEIPYGVVEIEDQSVKGILEKPLQRYQVNAGIYVLDQEAIDIVSKEQMIDMTEVLIQQISANRKVNAYPIHEDWADIGRHSDYRRAIDTINIPKNLPGE